MRKNKVKRHDIPVSEYVFGGTTRDELIEAQETERMLANQDIYVEQTKEKKNTLESFVYDTREKVYQNTLSFYLVK